MISRARFKRFTVTAVLAAAMIAGALQPASAFLDKTRFLAHLGVAYFCFHHWVMNPYREGDFAQGAPHRVAAIVKGGAALLFAVHEVKVSEKIAQKSKDPLLQKLDAGLGGLTSSFASVGQRLKSGHFNPQDIEGLQSATASEQAQAQSQGANIKDVPVALPGGS